MTDHEHGSLSASFTSSSTEAIDQQKKPENVFNNGAYTGLGVSNDSNNDSSLLMD